jgi:hypothetical protein
LDPVWEDYQSRLEDLAEMYGRIAMQDPDQGKRNDARMAHIAILQVMAIPLQIEAIEKRREEALLGPFMPAPKNSVSDLTQPQVLG